MFPLDQRPWTQKSRRKYRLITHERQSKLLAAPSSSLKTLPGVPHQEKVDFDLLVLRPGYGNNKIEVLNYDFINTRKSDRGKVQVLKQERLSKNS